MNYGGVSLAENGFLVNSSAVMLLPQIIVSSCALTYFIDMRGLTAGGVVLVATANFSEDFHSCCRHMHQPT